MEREQFTFYASFARAVRRIKNKAVRCDAYDAIVCYALTGELPDLDSLPDAAAIAFEMARPNVDASRRKAENGKAGGKQSGSKREANGKQSESKPEANRKQEEEESKNKGKGKNKIKDKCPPPTPSDEFSDDLLSAVEEWLAYKAERKDKPYTTIGLRQLFGQIRNSATIYGDAAVAEVIRSSMASNYQGIVFDRLQQRRVQPTRSSNPFLNMLREEGEG